MLLNVVLLCCLLGLSCVECHRADASRAYKCKKQVKIISNTQCRYSLVTAKLHNLPKEHCIQYKYCCG